MNQSEILNILYQNQKEEKKKTVDINKLIVLKDCLYYEGTHKYYIFQSQSKYTLMTDADKKIALCRSDTLSDVIRYIEQIEQGKEVLQK